MITKAFIYKQSLTIPFIYTPLSEPPITVPIPAVTCSVTIVQSITGVVSFA